MVRTAAQAAEQAKTYGYRPFFELVDHFRSLDSSGKANSVTVPPGTTGDRKLDALLASMVAFLCNEAGIECPDWSLSWNNWLDQPWFFSDVDRLYAYALVESPPEFRMNNIFVLGNFMERV